jgi:glycerol kinase
MNYILAIDQGTTSTRCMVFDHTGQVVAHDQKEHQQIYSSPVGWNTIPWRFGPVSRN